MQDLEDRIAGVLLGLAAGDRIGGPARMALRVAESLCDRGGFDVADIAVRYLQWWHEGAFDTGPTVARVLSLVASGLPFEEASTQVDEEAHGMTAGCNPAHRIAPLAMCSVIDGLQIEQMAITEARLTHRHPLAGDVAAAVARLCRELIQGVGWQDALNLAVQERRPEIRSAVEVSSSGVLSRDGYAPNVLGAAVHFVHTSSSFPSALSRAIDFAGPDNYCPVLVGSIGGARWGADQVDEKLLRHHETLVPQLTAAASTLAAGWRNAERFPFDR